MVPNTGPMGGLQRVLEAFEIISKYLIVSLGRKSIHSVYWIFRRINDHHPPKDVKNHYYKFNFLFYDPFSKQ